MLQLTPSKDSVEPADNAVGHEREEDIEKEEEASAGQASGFAQSGEVAFPFKPGYGITAVASVILTSLAQHIVS